MGEDKQTFSKLHGALDIEIAIEKIEQVKKDISCRWIGKGKIVIKFSTELYWTSEDKDKWELLFLLRRIGLGNEQVFGIVRHIILSSELNFIFCRHLYLFIKHYSEYCYNYIYMLYMYAHICTIICNIRKNMHPKRALIYLFQIR